MKEDGKISHVSQISGLDYVERFLNLWFILLVEIRVKAPKGLLKI